MGFIKGLLGYEDPPPPDPAIGEAAKSNSAIAGRAQDLAEKQYADQKALYDQFSPTLQKLFQSSVDAQTKATQQSDQQWADYQSTWRPIEAKLADASLNWASPGRIDQNAQEAASGVAGQYATARQQSRDDMIRAGMDPTAISALEASGRLDEAKATAGAANTARRTTEQQGMAYLDDAARFGRNMPSTGIQTASLAQAAGGQAGQQYGQLTSAAAAPAASAAPLFSTAVGANNSAGSLYGTLWGQSAAGAASNNAFLGDLYGAAGKAAGMYFSSKKLKRVGKKVDGLDAVDAVEASPSKNWTYKPGLGDLDQKPRIGPMAEDLRDATGGVVSDGQTVDAISMAGLHHAAIGNLSARIKRLEKSAGLADARGS